MRIPFCPKCFFKKGFRTFPKIFGAKPHPTARYRLLRGFRTEQMIYRIIGVHSTTAVLSETATGTCHADY
jgi:hypothetical protein